MAFKPMKNEEEESLASDGFGATNHGVLMPIGACGVLRGS